MGDENKFGIKHWAEEDRPREKLLLKGQSSLSNAELLAILIRSGTRTITAVDLAKQIMKAYGNDLANIARLSVEELMRFKGIGEAKAITIVSALELGRRKKDEMRDKFKISQSSDVNQLMSEVLADLSHEEFWIVLLNRANRVLNKRPISRGGISGTVVDPKIVFKLALDNKASNVILVHNHPSGNKQPSRADRDLTRKMTNAGKLLDIGVLDHIIYTDHGFYSFADEGQM